MGNSGSTEANGEKAPKQQSKIEPNEQSKAEPKEQSLKKDEKMKTTTTGGDPENKSKGGNKLIVSVDTQYDEFTYSKVCGNFLSQLCIEAPKYEKENRPSVDIVCCLDVSGSMAGDRISLVRKSIRRLVRMLNAGDRLCFVTFDTDVKVLMAFTNMDDKGKEIARNFVHKMKDGSSTNLCGGLLESISQMKGRKDTNEVCSILLFTDGEANAGITDTKGIIAAARKATGTIITNPDPEKWSTFEVCSWLELVGLEQYQKSFQENKVDGQMLVQDLNEKMLTGDLGVKSLHMKKFTRELEKLRLSNEGEEGKTKTGGNAFSSNLQVRIHTFGYGSSHNTDLLQDLANQFDGMYYFMEDEEAIKEGFANCMGGLLSTVAQEITVQFIPKKGVKDFVILKNDHVEQDRKRGIMKVHFGDLQSEEKRHILCEFSLPKLKKADLKFPCFEATVEYSNLMGGAKKQTKESITCLLNRSGKEKGQNKDIDVQNNRQKAVKATTEAEALADKGKIVEARAVVNKCIKMIQSSFSVDEIWSKNCVKDLGTTLESLKDNTSYVSYGKHYMAQNAMCWEQERACNYNLKNVTQMQYNNVSREEAYDAMCDYDSDDSACTD